MPEPSPGPSSVGQNCRWARRRPLYCLNYDLMSDVSVTFMCVPRSPARHCGRDAAPPPAPLSGAAPPRPPDRRGVPGVRRLGQPRRRTVALGPLRRPLGQACRGPRVPGQVRPGVQGSRDPFSVGERMICVSKTFLLKFKAFRESPISLTLCSFRDRA